MQASRFKARCLTAMDKARATAEPVVVTKRGVPVVEVVRVDWSKDDWFGYKADKVNIVAPLSTGRHVGRDSNRHPHVVWTASVPGKLSPVASDAIPAAKSWAWESLSRPLHYGDSVAGEEGKSYHYGDREGLR